jgi:hypothetical protein
VLGAENSLCNVQSGSEVIATSYSTDTQRSVSRGEVFELKANLLPVSSRKLENVRSSACVLRICLHATVLIRVEILTYLLVMDIRTTVLCSSVGEFE